MRAGELFPRNIIKESETGQTLGAGELFPRNIIKESETGQTLGGFSACFSGVV